ncbi:hypothetical protein NXS19_004457 [Fusarium pseudograminearum]|nr:hypothetical protein NXS19_004457 [Fusarium pseudograminearum]
MTDRREIRLQYVDACNKGRALAIKLHSDNTSAQCHPTFADHYALEYGVMQPNYVTNQTQATNMILRAYNVDTNRLSYREVYSNANKDEYVLMANIDARSGFLTLSEAKRRNDETAWGCGRLEISELLWQSKPLSALRVIWADTIVNKPTQAIVWEVLRSARKARLHRMV